ncbi:MAG: hydroxyacid dehydrogenase [Candidatus Paceibacterota bacterium]
MSKVEFFEVKPWEKEYLEEKLKAVSGIEVSYFEERINKDNIPTKTDCEILSMFSDSALDNAVLEKFPNLKYLITRSTGFDHIDLNYCKEHTILVSNIPSYGENTVAEFAFALILALSRKIFTAVDQIKETGDFNVDKLQGFDLRGKTLGVIGAGKIGQHSIRMANGFGMKVVAYDPFPKPELAQSLQFEYLPLEEVLKQSDVITLHTPYTKENHHLINENAISLMKKGVYIVNTSRGAIIDTEALVKGLKSGHVGGAGLDVFEEEGVVKDEKGFLEHGDATGHNLKTIIADHVLIDFPNVIMTPHNAFNSREALQRILDTSVENLSAYLSGAPINLVK